jgi:hypothetical protein
VTKIRGWGGRWTVAILIPRSGRYYFPFSRFSSLAAARRYCRAAQGKHRELSAAHATYKFRVRRASWRLFQRAEKGSV